MGRVIRWGFWGLGGVADAMAQDLRLVADATLVAVAARDASASAAFGDRHGVARRHVGLEALLADPEVDVVYVATPAHRHADDCLAAIAAGKAVLCEKPFALDAAQARSVADAAEGRGVFCMEAMWTRFVPAVREARRTVVDGGIGRVRLLTGDFAYPSHASDPVRLLDPAAGGGALLDRGIYLVSLAQHLLGAPDDVRATAVGPEQMAFTLRFPEGALAAFAASMQTRGGNGFAIHGETGSLVLEDPFYRAHRLGLRRFDPAVPPTGARKGRTAPARPTLQAWKRRLDGVVRRLSGSRHETRVFPGHGYQFQIEEVVRCLSAGRSQSDAMPLADSIAVLRITDALQASLRP